MKGLQVRVILFGECGGQYWEYKKTKQEWKYFNRSYYGPDNLFWDVDEYQVWYTRLHLEQAVFWTNKKRS